MKKTELEDSLKLSLKQYKLPNWAKFRGDHEPQSCICDEAGNIIGFILKNTERAKLTLPELPNLEYCCISDNEKLTQLNFQGDFSKLTYLDVSDNALNKITLPKSLPNLEKCYAQNNQLAELNITTNLPKVQFIDWSGNQLKKLNLPAAPELQYLYLYNNQLSSFTFLELPKLQILDLEKNNLETLFFDLVYSSKISTLYLSGNPIKNIPDTVLGTGERHNSVEEVMAYLNSMGETEKATTRGIESLEKGVLIRKNMVPLRQAKMVLIGNGEVGKSSIRIKLLDKKAPLPSEADRTPGLDIAPYLIENLATTITNLASPINFHLNIWDFGGQGKYREIQQLFCNPKTLYLFVTAVDDLPTKEDYIGFEYWLSMVNAYSYDVTDKHFAPVIHILNKIDKGVKPVNEVDSLAKFPNINQFIKLSCQTLENFDQLEKGIQKVLPKVNSKIFSDVFARKWMEVKTELEQRQSENHLTLTQYEAICTANGLSQAEGKTWLRILDRIGTVIYFGENEALRNWIIVNPIWIKDALCKVIDSPFIKRGILDPTDFKNIWPEPTFSTEEHQKLIDLMVAYKLCYQQQNKYNETEYIVPALLKAKKPAFPDILCEAPHLQLQLEYAPFIPAGTVNKLMINLRKDIYNELKWKNNVVIQDATNNAYAHVWEDWKEKSIFINYYKIDVKVLHAQLISAVKEINETLKNTRFLHQLDFDIFVKQGENWDAVDTLKRYNIKEFSFLWEANNPIAKDLLKRRTNKPKSVIIMDEIKKLIARGNLSQALKMLATVNDGIAITQLQSRLSKLERNERLGIIEHSKAGIERNQITLAALSFLTNPPIAPGNGKVTPPPKKAESKIKTYISYAWGGDSTKVADLVEKELIEKGIPIHRDLGKMGYKDSIQGFMQEIGKGNRVIVIISKKYLESDYCMYELTQVYENKDFRTRIFPIILEDANIYKPIARLLYIKYWDEKIKELDAALKSMDSGVNLTEIQQELNNYADIRASFDEMAAILKDMNALNPEIHQNENFASLYQELTKG